MAETKAADAVEVVHRVPLQLSGADTALGRQAARRAEAGGMLDGPQLLALASVLSCAGRLSKQILPLLDRVRREAGPDSPAFAALRPLESRVRGVDACPELQGRVRGCVDDDGSVRSSASEAVKAARQRVATLAGRLDALLKGGEGGAGKATVVERKGRMCLAVPGGAEAVAGRKGLVLGSSVAGGVTFFEPQAAVAGNNALQEARGALADAEEGVLWALSGEVMGRLGEVQGCLGFVAWLDCTLAKARFGQWLSCCVPEIGEWGGSGSSRARKGGRRGEGARAHVSVQRLRHPLLAARHRRWAEDASAGERRPGPSQRLLSRRRAQGTASPGADEGGPGAPGGDPAEAAPPEPVPLDVVVAAPVRAVVITGPNTGGKTASLKALGLAALMSRAGVPIPAAEGAVLPWFR